MRKTTSSGAEITHEHERLAECHGGKHPWRRWGPYMAERAWGTVREDYSPDGSAWTFLTHDMARSKAYRWGEDGIAGLCDEQQILCFSPALWNGADPILKERLFGLSGLEGNHGEDVKEIYYYVDSTPTHSYMKFLYKYPQLEFPYAKLAAINAQRTTFEAEYELADTGAFRDSRYFDVFVEYAKAGPEEICIRIRAYNRGPETARLHLIPQLWFRNTWAWGEPRLEEPLIELTAGNENWLELSCRHAGLGQRFLYAAVNHDSSVAAAESPRVLFTDNESNSRRLYGIANSKAYAKDAFHELIVNDRGGVTNPLNKGTKAGVWYQFDVPPGEFCQAKLVLCDRLMSRPFAAFEPTFARRIEEADEFYDAVQPSNLSGDERHVQRQALAGLLLNKQFYYFDVRTWLRGDNPQYPPPRHRLRGRNQGWQSLSVAKVISMPDKWEYPWFAAWDLAFHVIPLAMIDVECAKDQLELILGEELMHPNGQVPAYEWEFSDVNPPVQAWAVWRVYNMEKHANGEVGDKDFLERCYHKLLLNFTWWVNRKDSTGRNIFQGGFLGLDNISVFDRSQPLPGGGLLEQADATGWMALFCLNLMSIGLELAQSDRVYEHLGIKFFEHFLEIAGAINREIVPGVKLWNETDGWYYDVVHGLNGRRDNSRQITVRSLVGLIPLFAAQVLKNTWFDKLPNFKARYEWLMANRPELMTGMSCVWTTDGVACLLSIVHYNRLQRILKRVLDEEEFLAPTGVRSLSRYHLANPFQLTAGQREWTVRYESGQSTTRLFGGNSNWRGPVWFPMNFMLITALRVYDRFYGDNLKVECPTGSGKMMTLNEVAMEIARRLCSTFLPDSTGHRRGSASNELYHREHFRQYVMFHEFFNGDDGSGLGACQQTGWTALVAKLLEQLAEHRKAPTTPSPAAP